MSTIITIISIMSVLAAILSVIYAKRTLESSQAPLLFIYGAKSEDSFKTLREVGEALVLQNIGTGLATDIRWKTENIAIHNQKLPSVLVPFHSYTGRQKERRFGKNFIVCGVGEGQYHIDNDKIAMVILKYKNIWGKNYTSTMSIKKTGRGEYETKLISQKTNVFGWF